MNASLSAVVRPRAISPATGETIPLESAVGEELDCGGWRIIQLVGGPGSGKTTALRYLAGRLSVPRIVWLDDPDIDLVFSQSKNRHVVFTSRKVHRSAPHVALSLAAWTNDDLIEYLLAAHPGQCRRVMARVQADPDSRLINGNPALWRQVLDELAAAGSLIGVRAAVERILGRIARSDEERLLATAWSLAIQAADKDAALVILQELATCDADFERIRPLRHQFPQRLLAAEHICRMLRQRQPNVLDRTLPQPLVGEVAARVANEPTLLDWLSGITNQGQRLFQPMAASILHATETGWRPAEASTPFLAGGYFSKAEWPGINLGKSGNDNTDLSKADLSGADLSGATLNHVHAHLAVFVEANLSKASLGCMFAVQADFSRADLREINGNQMDLRHAILQSARLDGASLIGVDFMNADVRQACFRGANLKEATLTASQIDGTDFTDADLEGCDLRHLPLRNTILTRASFAGAKLGECDLEGIELADADFYEASLRGAWLTGSVLPRADLRGADLSEAGLADIQWENADLRGADLRGCSFHMGSTRSGLVGSPYPGHGSKTGFYTDDYHDQSYKRPEEIRKANLYGADLRGAKFDGVDFYLVDLRGALFDDEVAEHLARCGAILEDRCG